MRPARRDGREAIRETGCPIEGGDETAAAHANLLEKVRGVGVQRVTLGLRRFDQLEETARPAWALQANREPDANRVVGRLEGLLSRLLGYILEGRGYRAVERPAVASH